MHKALIPFCLSVPIPHCACFDDVDDSVPCVFCVSAPKSDNLLSFSLNRGLFFHVTGLIPAKLKQTLHNLKSLSNS